METIKACFVCLFPKNNNEIYPPQSDTVKDTPPPIMTMTPIKPFENEHTYVDECWICLDEGNTHQWCGCQNRKAHKHCLCDWQFANIGKHEENVCRFCNQQYTYSWKNIDNTQFVNEKLKKIHPSIYVGCNGCIKKIKLHTDGLDALKEIKKHFQDQNYTHIVIKIHGCQEFAINTATVSPFFMSNVVCLAKLSNFQRMKQNAHRN